MHVPTSVFRSLARALASSGASCCMSLLCFAFAANTPAIAQTFDLPDSIFTLSYANGNGGNFSMSDVPVTIDGVGFALNFSGHVMPDNSLYPPLSAVTFWNQQNTNLVSGGQLTGSVTPCTSMCGAIIDDGLPAILKVTINASFDATGPAGEFVGSAVLRVYHYGRTGIKQSNSVLTLTSVTLADGGILPLCPPSLCNVKCKCDKARDVFALMERPR